MPQLQDFERVLQVIARLVQQHIPEPAADDHAEHAPEQQVVDILDADPPPCLACTQPPQPRKQQKAGQVHQAIPANRQGANLESNRVELRVYQHGARQELKMGNCRGDVERCSATLP